MRHERLAAIGMFATAILFAAFVVFPVNPLALQPVEAHEPESARCEGGAKLCETHEHQACDGPEFSGFCLGDEYTLWEFWYMGASADGGGGGSGTSDDGGDSEVDDSNCEWGDDYIGNEPRGC